MIKNVGNCGFPIYKAALLNFDKNGWGRGGFCLGVEISRRDSDMLFWPERAAIFRWKGFEEYDHIILWWEENNFGKQLTGLIIQTEKQA